ALMAGATNGEPAGVQALLAAGAGVNAADASGGVVLTDAAAAGAADALVLLPQHGAKGAPLGLILAAAGCYTGAVRVLLSSGLTANTAVDGNAPLLAATGENCADTVALLLERGADVNVKNADGWTPLIKAASANFPDVARVLLKHGADL